MLHCPRLAGTASGGSPFPRDASGSRRLFEKVIAFVAIQRAVSLSALQCLQSVVERLRHLDPVFRGTLASLVAAVGRQASALLRQDEAEQLLAVRDLLFPISVGHEAYRVHRQHELTAAACARVGGIVLTGLDAEKVADKRTSEQFDHRRERGSLESAEWKLRAEQRLLRIGRRLSVGPDRPTLWELAPVTHPDLNFAARTRARRHVEAERRTILSGPRKRHRIGAEQRLRATGGRDVWARGNKRHANETSVGQTLDLGPQR